MSTIRANTITDTAGTGAPTFTNGAVLPAGSAAAPAISPTGDSNTGVFFPAADTIAFTEGGAEAMRIDASGNVGIGTAAPAEKLEIANSSAAFTIAKTTNTLGYGKWGTRDTGDAFVEYSSSKNLSFWSGVTEQARLTGAGLLQFNSGYGSVATAYGCRAWVNFNGTGTVAIRASGNVSSITDNGTGNYTVNFTTNMPDANYASFALCGGNRAAIPTSDTDTAGSLRAKSTTSYNINFREGSGTQADPSIAQTGVFR